MPRLFVEKSIQINAPIAKVWEVLVKAQFTNQWWREYGIDGGVESDWKTGSEILCKNKDGKVYVKGTVIAVHPYELLRFTAFDVNVGPEGGPDDYGLTFTLSNNKDRTVLSIVQGDFAKITNGEKHYNEVPAAWNKALPKIKELAETRLS